MNEKIRPSSGASPDRLGSYLAAAVGASTLAATADAAIVNLDLSALSGPNAGLASGAASSISLQGLDARLTGTLHTFNAKIDGADIHTGLGGSGVDIVNSDYIYARPQKFSAGSTIDGNSSYFSSYHRYTVFRFENRGYYYPPYTYNDIFYPGSWYDGATYTSPDFGAGSFLGFRSNGHYGWLEVTWNSSTQVFQILGGAFEDVAGVGIQAGAVAAVPEPAGVLGTLSLLAGGAFVRRRKLPATKSYTASMPAH